MALLFLREVSVVFGYNLEGHLKPLYPDRTYQGTLQTPSHTVRNCATAG